MDKLDKYSKVADIVGAIAGVLALILTLRTDWIEYDSTWGRILLNYQTTLAIMIFAVISIGIAVFVLNRQRKSVILEGTKLPYYSTKSRQFARFVVAILPFFYLSFGLWALIRETPDTLFPPFRIVDYRYSGTEICFALVNSSKEENIIIEHLEFEYTQSNAAPNMPEYFSFENTGECEILPSGYPVENIGVPLSPVTNFIRMTDFSSDPLVLEPGQVKYFKITFNRSFSQPVETQMRIGYFEVHRGHIVYILPFSFFI